MVCSMQNGKTKIIATKIKIHTQNMHDTDSDRYNYHRVKNIIKNNNFPVVLCVQDKRNATNVSQL